MTPSKPCEPKPTWHIFVDGASRNNPGPSGAGIFIRQDDETIAKYGFYLGKKTNNQAEYLSLLLALFIAKKEIAKLKTTLPKLLIHSDSELMVKQIKGIYRVRNEKLIPLKQIAMMLLLDQPFTIKHILRDKNQIADALANKGIDSKRKLPVSFIAFMKDNGARV